MSTCLTGMGPAALSLVVPELRTRARSARCTRPYGHPGRHQTSIQVQNGPRLTLVTLRWDKSKINRPRKDNQ